MELLEKILDGENIADALQKVVSNKGAGGIDKISVDGSKKCLLQEKSTLKKSKNK